MDNYLIENVKNLMQKLPSNCYDGNKNPINTDWITQSEAKFQIKLPQYYQWFIENYGYIILWGEITKTIFPPEYQDEADQDIFNYHAIDMANDIGQADKLVFLITEDLQEYYFPIVNNQVQETVFLWDIANESEELYAENFLAFLLKEIPRNYPT